MVERTSIFLRKGIFMLLILPHLCPPGILHLFPELDRIIDAWIMISVMITLMIYVLNGKWSKIMLAITAYMGVSLLSTLINRGDYWHYFVTFGKMIAFCMLIELLIEYDGRMLVTFLHYILGIVVISNLIAVCFFPQGMYVTSFTNNWLLGYDNTHYNFIFPALCVGIIYAEYRQLSFLAKLCMIIIYSASIYITFSGASVVAVTVWIFLWIFSEVTNSSLMLNVWTILGVHIAFFFAIVVARIQILFKWLIVDILGKSLTFSNRTSRWDIAIHMFIQRPLLGWGYVDTDITRLRLNGFSHCHNHFLQILYQSGIVGMISFLRILILLNGSLANANNRKYKFIILDTLLCFFIVGQIEAITTMTMLFGIITIAYHIEEIEKQLDNIPGREPKIKFVFY